jgi:signal transduction histidine kinase
MARILVVDDDPALRETLVDILTVAGHEVEQAADGPSALAASAAYAPDCILLDIMMPGMSGLDVCRRLRADSRNDDLPILLVTALSESRDKVAGLEAGADDYVSKPFDMAELLARVKAVLRQRDLMRACATAQRDTATLNRELVREEERLRGLVADEIHDVIVQALVGTRLAVESGAVCSDPEPAVGAIDRGIESARGLIRMLRPPRVADGGMPELLRVETEVALSNTGITLRSDLPERFDALTPETTTMLYRMLSEAVANAIEHSGCTAIELGLSVDGDRVTATVADDGAGFDPQIVRSVTPGGPIGLASMSARAALIGGSVRVDSAPGSGTTVTIELPAEVGRARSARA